MIRAEAVVDIVWEGLPNWIAACSAALTLIAAVVAGVYARRAAHWTKAQAEATERQVDIEQGVLDITREEAVAARADAERQREEAERAHRRLDESRLDAVAPTVFAVASLPSIRFRPNGDPRAEWERVKEPVEVDDYDPAVVYRTGVHLSFENTSPHVAQIDITDVRGGSVYEDSNVPLVTGPIFLRPGETKDFSWYRVIGNKALSSEASVELREHSLFDLTFWVRDLGGEVRDSYMFVGDLRYFERRPGGIAVRPEPAVKWWEAVAVPYLPRSYERLHAPPND